MPSGVGEERNQAFGTSDTVEQYVRSYFVDAPIMADVARCESRFRHFNSKGVILRGEVNAADVGVMQINEYYHLSGSKKIGHDIHTLHGNLEYARHLYEEQGTGPWLSSAPCWGIENHIAMR